MFFSESREREKVGIFPNILEIPSNYRGGVVV